jgi:hypothetical protein
MAFIKGARTSYREAVSNMTEADWARIRDQTSLYEQVMREQARSDALSRHRAAAAEALTRPKDRLKPGFGPVIVGEVIS